MNMNWLWHAEKAPNGRLFTDEVKDNWDWRKDGWVDTPAGLPKKPATPADAEKLLATLNERDERIVLLERELAQLRESTGIDAIVDAIAQLPNDDEHFTSDGKPRVEAIEKILNKDITSEQRDEGFKAFNATYNADD